MPAMGLALIEQYRAILLDWSSCSLGVFRLTSLFTGLSQQDPLLAREAPGPILYTSSLCSASLRQTRRSFVQTRLPV